MGNQNHLVCWIENKTKKWEMVKEEDRNAFLLNLLTDKKVKKHTIFVIPTTGGFVQGIWLMSETHKSSRVDFWNFFDDIGTVYKPPKTSEDNQKIVHEIKERRSDNTKYGWISPEGKYYHCGYQGHIDLANKICFGVVETDNSERYLEEHGWCKIYKSLFVDNYSVYVGGDYEITDAQMKTLINMGLDNAKDLSKMLCKNSTTHH